MRQQCIIKKFIAKNKISKILILGYTDPIVHTHYWIHKAIYDAFISLNLELPINHVENVVNSDYDENVLCFFTYDNKNLFHMNVRESDKWFYMMLNHTYDSTYPVFMNNVTRKNKGVIYQVWRGPSTDFKSRSQLWPHTFDADGKRFTLTWAARQPPRQILSRVGIKNRHVISNRCVFIGTVWHRNIVQINELAKWCVYNSIPLQLVGKQYEKLDESICKSDYVFVDNRTISEDDAEFLIRSSRFSPAIQGKTQLPYVPCRAFINASYGKSVITNNYAVNKMLPRSYYNEDVYKMMDSAATEVPSDGYDLSLIDEVVSKHTYVHRISELISLLNEGD